MTWVFLKWSCFSYHENIGQSGLMACWVFSNLKDLQCELDFAQNITIITTKGKKQKQKKRQTVSLINSVIIIVIYFLQQILKVHSKAVAFMCKSRSFLCNEFPLALPEDWKILLQSITVPSSQSLSQMVKKAQGCSSGWDLQLLSK